MGALGAGVGIVAPPQPDAVVNAFTAESHAPDGLAKSIVDELFTLGVAYSPSLVAMRKTAGFASLAEKTGLMDYWKMPGHRPDFCNEPDAAALCATVSKS